jgi:hypothetical protein
MKKNIIYLMVLILFSCSSHENKKNQIKINLPDSTSYSKYSYFDKSRLFTLDLNLLNLTEGSNEPEMRIWIRGEGIRAFSNLFIIKKSNIFYYRFKEELDFENKRSRIPENNIKITEFQVHSVKIDSVIKKQLFNLENELSFSEGQKGDITLYIEYADSTKYDYFICRAPSVKKDSVLIKKINLIEDIFKLDTIVPPLRI